MASSSKITEFINNPKLELINDILYQDILNQDILDTDKDMWNAIKTMLRLSVPTSTKIINSLFVYSPASDNLELVMELYKYVSDINVTNYANETALLGSISYGNNIEITRFLLENGADPKHTNTENKNAITYANINGDYESLKLLVKYI